MTELEAVTLICSRFADATVGWPALTAALPGAPVGGYPFLFRNEKMATVDVFASCTVKHTASEQMTIGSHPRFRRGGWIFVKIWTPENTGDQLALELSDIARKVLQRQSLDPGDGTEPLTTQAGLSQELPTDGRWAMRVVQFPFYYFDQP